MLNNITDVPGIRVGNAEDPTGMTGCTVVLAGEGMVCGADIRGGAPGTRETDLLNPLNLVDKVHGICLTGGSAYGLDAAGGVMQYLEQQGTGLNVGVGVVPIVPAAVLFDLAVGDPRCRPSQDMGYRAASQAVSGELRQGNVGAGCGATVGKLAGMERAMKGGLGSASRRLDCGLVVGAIVAVNALGEIRHPEQGRVLAGVRSDDGSLLDSLQCLEAAVTSALPGTNTTIGVVACNAKLTKAQACKIASTAHDGLARTIYPVHTMADGDTLFALGSGELDVSIDLIAAVAAETVAMAVMNAILHADGIPGFPSCRDLGLQE
ncbi:P1 family peptidase [Paenibacillus sp. J2TS4]|uniref:P1 family peptidase n=1 Tax=Paenibacillus sp. J2TS4 TaxID=2807194 RepID=UPI001B0144B8|nr:P1 family peptidase [Paenibacillus sp. J2TS4]GIP32715.1 peptidase [Paenibacillus sp. J2TS4]